MERYVYQLTHALVQKGQQVSVLCEKNEAVEYNPLIIVVELGNAYHKPRWRAQWGFCQRVSQYFEQNPQPESVIHSHERTAVHHVTTFHGPPFLQRKRRLLDITSPRIRMWTQLEEQELFNEQVKAILPNAPLIASQLRTLYPTIAHKLRSPAYPGVDVSFSRVQRRSSGLAIGFLGREWKRKGLDIACRIISQLREQIPGVHFMVAGCDPDNIRHLFDGWPTGSYTLMGWSEPQYFFEIIDVLLHPARAEPFGMVIAEANAAGLPVVISDQCGAAALIGDEQGSICRLDSGSANVEHWVQACRQQLYRNKVVTSLNLSWETLAEQHIDLYRELQPIY
ncbi:hypothetical protein AB835_04090 [Candidatus Endobugula sertula]|uniref:Glycosyltransferase subfamily 4-like N-terminal domain-containing protein n=1 Tax=Candidatus Endobugula sertula TaxID=62101 RepID=A0A1D2QS66_9GAMM|nr:hypothetical protein AB835_04090 [Candidatus Endobugula sertula]